MVLDFICCQTRRVPSSNNETVTLARGDRTLLVASRAKTEKNGELITNCEHRSPGLLRLNAKRLKSHLTVTDE